MENNIIVLIPSYNPDTNLINLVCGLYKHTSFKIVIVDDGSTNKSGKIFSGCIKKAKIIHHKSNIGKGQAIKTGLKFIQEHYPSSSIIITCDGDGQHKLEDIIKIAKVSLNNKSALCLGTRNFNGSIPLRSKIGNNVTKLFFKIITNKYILDTQTGLRAFSSIYIDKILLIKGLRYEFEINVLLYFAKNNIKIVQIPISTIYIRNNSSSHFKVFKDSLLIYKSLIGL